MPTHLQEVASVAGGSLPRCAVVTPSTTAPTAGPSWPKNEATDGRGPPPAKLALPQGRRSGTHRTPSQVPALPANRSPQVEQAPKNFSLRATDLDALSGAAVRVLPPTAKAYSKLLYSFLYLHYFLLQPAFTPHSPLHQSARVAAASYRTDRRQRRSVGASGRETCTRHRAYCGARHRRQHGEPLFHYNFPKDCGTTKGLG